MCCLPFAAPFVNRASSPGRKIPDRSGRSAAAVQSHNFRGHNLHSFPSVFGSRGREGASSWRTLQRRGHEAQPTGPLSRRDVPVAHHRRGVTCKPASEKPRPRTRRPPAPQTRRVAGLRVRQAGSGPGRLEPGHWHRVLAGAESTEPPGREAELARVGMRTQRPVTAAARAESGRRPGGRATQ